MHAVLVTVPLCLPRLNRLVVFWISGEGRHRWVGGSLVLCPDEKREDCAADETRPSEREEPRVNESEKECGHTQHEHGGAHPADHGPSHDDGAHARLPSSLLAYCRSGPRAIHRFRGVRPTLAISCEGRTTLPWFTVTGPTMVLPLGSNRPSSAASACSASSFYLGASL
jgi:hypothetical protein